MSDAWEYKEAIWSEVDDNPFTFTVVRTFDDRNDEGIFEIERKKIAFKNQYIVPDDKRSVSVKSGPRGGKRKLEVTFYSIIEFRYRNYEYGNKERPIVDHQNKGYTLDDNGYPINLEEYISDFPKPPVSKLDAMEQLEKLYSDLYWDFPTWLGHHSREGWEIFKISRDFRGGSRGKSTWCVFRRRV